MSFPRTFVRRSVLAVALSSVLAPVAFAQDVPAATAAATDLDEVVVTATRTAQTQDATLAAITVIDRADIDRLQPTSISDLLRGTPGVSLSNNGGLGKATGVFLRGTEADHVLVLVDGIKIGSATLGQAALQDIPVEQIERIEIVRGPFSSLYGSEALGGVIQIFTRRPHSAFAPQGSLSLGSDRYGRIAGGVSGRGDRGWYSVNAAHEETEGFNSCRGPGGCFTTEPDNDGYKNDSLSLQGGMKFNEQWNAEARLLRAEADSEFDGGFSNESEAVQQTVGLRLGYAPVETIKLSLNLAESADLNDNFKDGVYINTFDTHRQQGSLQGDFGLGGGLVSVGYDWQRDEIGGTTAYLDEAGSTVESRINRGLFGQWQQTFGAHSLQLSARRDENSKYDGETTGSALWGWNFTEALRLTLSYGTAFKAPSFNELYYPFFGNPALRPETSRSAELGLRGKHGWGGWSITTFDTKVEDLIAYDADIFAPNNIEQARITGTEASVDSELAGWKLRGSFTLLNPRNDGTVYNDNLLPRRAKRTARFDLDRSFGDFSMGASVVGIGARVDNLTNTTRLGGYSTTDLRFGYAFAGGWNVQLSLNNVLDKQYETAAFYNQAGRNYLLTLRYTK